MFSKKYKTLEMIYNEEYETWKRIVLDEKGREIDYIDSYGIWFKREFDENDVVIKNKTSFGINDFNKIKKAL